MPRMSMTQIDVGFKLSASQWLTELQNLAISHQQNNNTLQHTATHCNILQHTLAISHQQNNPIYHYERAVSLKRVHLC